MTDAAFDVDRLAEVNPAGFIGIGLLIMRVVAADAVIDRSMVCDRLTAVFSCIDLIRDVGVALDALLRLKEIFQ